MDGAELLEMEIIKEEEKQRSWTGTETIEALENLLYDMQERGIMVLDDLIVDGKPQVTAEPDIKVAEMVALERCIDVLKKYKKQIENLGKKRKYSKEESKKIIDWYRERFQVTADWDPNECGEYKPGQLLDGVGIVDSLNDWKEWQHLQDLLDKVQTYNEAMDISNMLHENGIDTLSLSK